MNSLHGHEVINFIKDSDPKIKKEALILAIEDKFGDARFHTCSQEGMTPEQLIEFLETADKLYFVKGRANIRTSNVCSHDD